MSYATLHELKSYRGILTTETGKDTILRAFLDRATTAIENHTGRMFEASTQTRYFESEALDGNNGVLWMDEDLLTITTLTNGDDDATVITPSTEYWLIDRNMGPPYYGIRLKSDSTYSWEWDVDGWVSVEGTWGYSATPPGPVRQACIRWASYNYDQKDSPIYDVTVFPESGIVTVPQGMPMDVRILLGPYRRRMG